MAAQKGKKRREYTVSSKALAQRRNNFTLIPAETKEEMNYNARQIEHIMRVHEIASHADKNDLNSLKSCFINYLKLCQEDGFPVSNMACYSAMGMNTSAFCAFERKDDPEIKQFVAMVKGVCAMSREAQVGSGKLNPLIGIFWQRNYDGLRNDTEQIQSINEHEDDDTSNKSYKEKYKNLIGE